MSIIIGFAQLAVIITMAVFGFWIMCRGPERRQGDKVQKLDAIKREEERNEANHTSK